MNASSFKALAIAVITSASTPCSATAADGITARIVTADQRKDCKYLGLVTYREAMGWNKAGGALRNALRKVQEMGGDSLYVITEHQGTIEGASINGEALRCEDTAVTSGANPR